MDDPIEGLNAATRELRLAALRRVAARIAAGEEATIPTVEVNNHVHTIYSFSPYSPSMVAYRAWRAGLQAVGAMDHDSVGGAEEMIEAAKIMGIGSTVGFEIRTSFRGTAMEGRKLNNPDAATIVYITVHGIPRPRLAEASRFLEPVRQARNLRNRHMVAALNELIAPYGLEPLDFERDVASISQAHRAGSITERHILYALVGKIIDRTGRGLDLIRFVEEVMGVPLSRRVREYLGDELNPHYRYDLLGALKGSFLPRFYLEPEGRECPPVAAVVAFASSIGAIPAYPYLGDVEESPTGDKLPEKFEDDFLDELFPLLIDLGFKAVTYMPPRNSRAQLARIRSLCKEHDLMEISGVDINSSRQSFSCPEILRPEFHHLIDMTWALIAHEKLASLDERLALFSPENPLAGQTLSARIARYADAGRKLDRSDPENDAGREASRLAAVAR